MTPQEVNKALAGRFMQALDCLEAVERAGLSPSALAADPEAIKRVVEAAMNAVAVLRMVRDGAPAVWRGHPDGITERLASALRAIGKEQA